MGNEKPKRRRGRPSPEETKTLERQLIRAATRLFVRHGFSGTSMEAIARAAGIGKKALYARHPDKESAFAAVIERGDQQRVAAELGAYEGLPLEESLFRRASFIIAESTKPDNIAFYNLLLREGPRTPRLGLIFKHALAHAIEVLAEYFGNLRNAGVIVDIEPTTVASMFILSIFGDLSNRMLYRLKVPTATETAAYLRPLCALFARGLSVNGGDRLPNATTFSPAAIDSRPRPTKMAQKKP